MAEALSSSPTVLQTPKTPRRMEKMFKATLHDIAENKTACKAIKKICKKAWVMFADLAV